MGGFVGFGGGLRVEGRRCRGGWVRGWFRGRK